MHDLILSSVYGLGAAEVAPFAVSLADSGFCGKQIMVTFDQNQERDRFLAEFGWDVQFAFPEEAIHPFLQRFAVFRSLLSELRDIRYVLSADCRDVVFQQNPSDVLPLICPPGHFLAASEAIKLRYDQWATDFTSSNYPLEWREIMDCPSYCAGTIAGSAEICQELYGAIFRLAITGRSHRVKPCDQPAFNIICNQRLTNSLAIPAREECAFAATCGTMLEPKFASRLTEPAPTVWDWQVVNSNGVPFLLVHQYERIPGLAKSIVEHYCRPNEEEPEKPGTYQGFPVMDAFEHPLLTGKTVALVGPSPSVRDRGQEIDGAEVVVRMNRALLGELDAEHVGARTDILYHCLHESRECGGPIPYETLKDRGITLFSPYPAGVHPFDQDVRRFRATNREHLIPYHIIDRNHYLEIARACGTRPNTGIAAIMDILAHRPACLHVYGFTFFRDGFSEGYKVLEDQQLEGWMASDFNGNHHQEPQRLMIRDAWRNFPEILKPDETMREILEQ